MRFAFLVILIGFCVSGCDKSDAHNCDALKEALVVGDEAGVKRLINSLIPKFHPQPAANDQEGFRPHFDALMEKLGACDIRIVFSCYACVDTYPPISELSVEVTSGGQVISRTIDLMQDKGSGRFECKSMH